MKLSNNHLITGFVIGIFFSYAMFRVPDCINKQLQEDYKKVEVAC